MNLHSQVSHQAWSLLWGCQLPAQPSPAALPRLRSSPVSNLPFSGALMRVMEPRSLGSEMISLVKLSSAAPFSSGSVFLWNMTVGIMGTVRDGSQAASLSPGCVLGAYNLGNTTGSNVLAIKQSGRIKIIWIHASLNFYASLYKSSQAN